MYFLYNLFFLSFFTYLGDDVTISMITGPMCITPKIENYFQMRWKSTRLRYVESVTYVYKKVSNITYELFFMSVGLLVKMRRYNFKTE